MLRYGPVTRSRRDGERGNAIAGCPETAAMGACGEGSVLSTERAACTTSLPQHPLGSFRLTRLRRAIRHMVLRGVGAESPSWTAGSKGPLVVGSATRLPVDGRADESCGPTGSVIVTTCGAALGGARPSCLRGTCRGVPRGWHRRESPSARGTDPSDFRSWCRHASSRSVHPRCGDVHQVQSIHPHPQSRQKALGNGCCRGWRSELRRTRPPAGRRGRGRGRPWLVNVPRYR